MKNFCTSLVIIFITFSIHAQQYQPVDEKSEVKFSIKNFGIATSGEFKGLSGTIDFDKAGLDKAVFDVSVESAKINTDNDAKDSHLRKEEYFDVGKFPKITFKSEKITGKGSGFMVAGNLTIKGTTKKISFPFTAAPKDDGYLFEGSFQINRRDFNVGSSSMVLSDNLTVTLSVFAKKK